MPSRKLLSTVAAMLVALSSVAVADEKLDAVEKEITAKFKAIKSMTAKAETKMDIDQGGMKMSNSITQTIEYLRKDGKWLSRMEGKMETVMDMGGQKQTMESPMLSVSDGEFKHVLMEQMGQKMCMKTKAEESDQPGAAMFKTLKENHDLTLDKDAEIGGEKCWTINAKPKQITNPMEPAKLVFHFRQKDGAMVQMLGFNAEDKKFMTMTVSDIKFDQKLDPKRFEFKVPEGVQVRDMTNQP